MERSMSGINEEVILYVRYDGPPDARFDRTVYVRDHLPMVLDAWTKYGLLSAVALFPAAELCGTIALCECRFRDEAAISAAFGSPETAAIIEHIHDFTDLSPSRHRVVPVELM